MKTLLSFVFVSLALPAAIHAGATKPVPAAAPSPAAENGGCKAVVRVNATNQPFDYARPWTKKNPFPRRGSGAILEGGKVLVTAELIANNTHLEIEKPLTADKSPAEILAVDYDANLALIRPLKENFLADLGAFELAADPRVGDSAQILQVESNGEIVSTPATLTTISVNPYPLESLSLLTFKLSAPLQSRDSSFVLPAVKDGRLLGLLMRYDARTQTADLIPSPVIASFLKRAEKTPYEGFPRVGLSFSSTRDPQLRSYLGLTQPGGVYVTEVVRKSPAAEAGLQRGDILLTLDGQAIDQDGLYEHPVFGKILFTHLVTTRSPDAGPIKAEVLRDGKPLTMEIQPRVIEEETTVSDAHSFDKPPRFLVLGGLVFQELSRAFLREWGGNWRATAPQRLVYLDAFQSELPEDRGKIVFLSAVLPSLDTLGYENLENQVITKINGVDIKSLEDAAEAIKQPVNGFHKIEFEEDPGYIFLDAESVRRNQEALARDYGITEMQRL